MHEQLLSLVTHYFVQANVDFDDPRIPAAAVVAIDAALEAMHYSYPLIRGSEPGDGDIVVSAQVGRTNVHINVFAKEAMNPTQSHAPCHEPSLLYRNQPGFRSPQRRAQATLSLLGGVFSYQKERHKEPASHNHPHFVLTVPR
jgi:hypothetical protein